MSNRTKLRTRIDSQLCFRYLGPHQDYLEQLAAEEAAVDDAVDVALTTGQRLLLADAACSAARREGRRDVLEGALARLEACGDELHRGVLGDGSAYCDFHVAGHASRFAEFLERLVRVDGKLKVSELKPGEADGCERKEREVGKGRLIDLLWCQLATHAYVGNNVARLGYLTRESADLDRAVEHLEVAAIVAFMPLVGAKSRVRLAKSLLGSRFPRGSDAASSPRKIDRLVLRSELRGLLRQVPVRARRSCADFWEAARLAALLRDLGDAYVGKLYWGAAPHISGEVLEVLRAATSLWDTLELVHPAGVDGVHYENVIAEGCATKSSLALVSALIGVTGQRLALDIVQLERVEGLREDVEWLLGEVLTSYESLQEGGYLRWARSLSNVAFAGHVMLRGCWGPARRLGESAKRASKPNGKAAAKVIVPDVAGDAAKAFILSASLYDPIKHAYRWATVAEGEALFLRDCFVCSGLGGDSWPVGGPETWKARATDLLEKACAVFQKIDTLRFDECRAYCDGLAGMQIGEELGGIGRGVNPEPTVEDSVTFFEARADQYVGQPVREDLRAFQRHLRALVKSGVDDMGLRSHLVDALTRLRESIGLEISYKKKGEQGVALTPVLHNNTLMFLAKGGARHRWKAPEGYQLRLRRSKDRVRGRQ